MKVVFLASFFDQVKMDVFLCAIFAGFSLFWEQSSDSFGDK